LAIWGPFRLHKILGWNFLLLQKKKKSHWDFGRDCIELALGSTDILTILGFPVHEWSVCLLMSSLISLATSCSFQCTSLLSPWLNLLYKYLKCKSEPHVKIEGKDTDDWLCVDFGSMVIHLMLPETRETYELEKLWTLRSYDDQLAQIASETLPEDFILGIEEDTSSLTPVEFK